MMEVAGMFYRDPSLSWRMALDERACREAGFDGVRGRDEFRRKVEGARDWLLAVTAVGVVLPVLNFLCYQVGVNRVLEAVR